MPQMKSKNIIIPLLLALGVAVPSQAQRTKRKVLKKPVHTVTAEERLEQERQDQMTASTQKIVVVDSVVVPKASFLEHYKLNPEVGSIRNYNEFFNVNGYADTYVNIDQMGGKCFFSRQTADGNTALFSSDYIGNKWTRGTMLKGIDTTVYKHPNYPFMMTDGTTFYFAAKGPESIGGYDIFVTRYDAETQSFLKPENVGMPFNSTGNDYMMAVDDIEHLGLFVTDRRQKKGNVCIYTFIPNEAHDVYPAESMPPEKLKSLAMLNRIADTWGNGKERLQALTRIKKIEESRPRTRHGAFAFVVNDSTVYTHLSEFKRKGNKERFGKLQEMRKGIKLLQNDLDRQRDLYATQSPKGRQSMKSDILKKEQQLEKLETQAKQLEKTIRNYEIQGI